jgi:probable HAF family extracellular repeat protein
MIIRLALLGLLVPPCGATGGPRTTIRLAPIAINGNNDIAITAINDSGAVAGVLTDPAGYHVLVVTPDAVTELMRLLPGLNGCCAPVVRFIDNLGDVGGTNCESMTCFGWIFRHGKQIGFSLGDYDASRPSLMADANGDVAYDSVAHVMHTPFMGPDHKPEMDVGLPGGVSSVQSMNARGVMAGTTLAFFGRLLQCAMFVGRRGHFAFSAPPGATSISVGGINDADEVAGAFREESGLEHGFLERHGAFQFFTLPQGATEVTVTAINDAGRVVGSYLEGTKQARQGFLYDNTSIIILGAFAPNDEVNVAINDRGDMVLSATGSHGARSYWATCSVSGC